MAATFMHNVLAFLLIASIFVAVVAFTLKREQTRREGWRNLAIKFGLLLDPPRPTAPEPAIRGIIFRARFSNWMEGKIDGVTVVAFDYVIGYGRNARLGSGVGIERSRLPFTPPRGFSILYEAGWTYLYSKSFRLTRLDAEEIENAWRVLLQAAGRSLDTPSAVNEAVPQGIVIRPRRKALRG